MGELRLGRFAAARDARFSSSWSDRPIGYLAEAAALGEAECAEGLNDYDAAVAIYERLSRAKTTAPDEVLMRLGGAAKSAGDSRKAAEAFGRVLYDFPLVGLRRWRRHRIRRSAERPAAGRRQPAVQARARTRRAAVRRAALRRGAQGVLRRCGRSPPATIASSSISGSPKRDYYQKRVRVGARRAQAVHDESDRVKAKRSSSTRWLSAISASRTSIRKAVRRIVDEFPTAELGRGSAQQPRDAAHVADEDDEADAVVPRAVREVSARHATPSARPGKRAGARTGRSVHADTDRDSSSGRPPSSRAPTTGRRGCTGPGARTICSKQPSAGRRALHADGRRLHELRTTAVWR